MLKPLPVLRTTYRSTDYLQGQYPADADYQEIITESTRVIKPNGELLGVYLKGVVPKKLALEAFEVLKGADLQSKNRGLSTHAGEQVRVVNPNGTRSKTNQLPEAVNSGIIGYYDRYTRTPYCRECAWNRQHPEQWQKLYPYVAFIDKAMATYAPEHHRRQLEFARRTNPAWVIGSTAFTTITVNQSYQTAVHKDAGDLKEGIGVISCLRAGDYSGGYLVLPEYQVAFDLGSCDVLLFDVHAWHGNTTLNSSPGSLRVTCVFYYRENMIRCGTPEYELATVEARKPKSPIWSHEEVAKGNDLATQALVAAALTKTPPGG